MNLRFDAGGIEYDHRDRWSTLGESGVHTVRCNGETKGGVVWNENRWVKISISPTSFRWLVLARVWVVLGCLGSRVSREQMVELSRWRSIISSVNGWCTLEAHRCKWNIHYRLPSALHPGLGSCVFVCVFACEIKFLDTQIRKRICLCETEQAIGKSLLNLAHIIELQYNWCMCVSVHMWCSAAKWQRGSLDVVWLSMFHFVAAYKKEAVTSSLILFLSVKGELELSILAFIVGWYARKYILDG